MYTKPILIFLILVCGTSLLGQTRLESEEYAVYASVLKSIYEHNRDTYSNKSEFVIINQTMIDPEVEMPSEKKYRSLINDFNRANLFSAVIERNFPPGEYSETYHLVSQAEIDELNEKGRIEYKQRFAKDRLDPTIINPGGVRYTVFFEKYPESSGYYSPSRVGFSGQHAVVQVKGDLGWRGFSRFYLLKKLNGEWQITNFGGIEWIS